MVTVKINGNKVEVEPGTTILEAARTLKIRVPTLCYHPAVKSARPCGVCAVELKQGEKVRTVAACSYAIKEDGLEVQTASERARQSRRKVLERLLVSCPEVEAIQSLAREAGVENIPAPKKEKGAEEGCILCGLCVNVCREVVGVNALSMGGKETERKEKTPFLARPENCIGCGSCAYICPTSFIRMTETDGVREIWGKRFPMAVCPQCGNSFAPQEQLEFIQKKVSLPPDHFQYCFTCRGLKF